MKKKIIAIFSLILIAVSIFFISSCGLIGGSNSNKNKVQLETSMVTYNKTHTSVAEFDKNFIPSYSGKAITLNESEFTFKVNDEYADRKDFSFAYENNINVGTAKVTITAADNNELCYGSISFTFNIQPGTIYVSNLIKLQEILYNSNYQTIHINSELTIEENDSINIAHNQKVYLTSKITNYGTITNTNGELYIGNTVGSSGTINNYGTIDNKSKLEVNNKSYIYNQGNVNNTGSINSLAQNFFSNSEIAGLTETSYKLRHKVTEDDLNFITDYDKANKTITYKQGNYDYRIVSSVSNTTSNDTYEVNYSNIAGAGNASFSVKIKDTDRLSYGTLDYNFTITKGEATFDTMYTLYQLMETGNYNSYIYKGIASNNFEITNSQVLTIDEDETVDFSSSTQPFNKYYLVNKGSIDNHGKLVIKYLSTSASIFNYGELDVEILTIGNATYKNGKLDNSGTVKANTINDYGNVINTSKMTVASTLFVGNKLENSSNIDVTGHLSVGTVGIVTNKANATITLSDSTTNHKINKNATVTNNGTITNKGNLVIDEATITNSNLVNNGSIYTKINIQNVSGTGSYVLKSQLTTADLNLEYVEVDYDGFDKKPTVTFNESVDSDLYKVSYKNVTANSTTQLNTVGDYKATVTINKDTCKYYGNVELDYEVVKSIAYVTTQYSLSSKLSNKNYKKVVLNCDAILNTATTISKDMELDLNGHKLTISNCKVTNYGTITNKKNLNSLTKTFDNCGIVLSDSLSTRLNNYGSITNDNIIYAYPRATINNLTDTTVNPSVTGTITNTGYIYTCEAINGTTNNVYVRKTLESLLATACVTLASNTKYYYTGNPIQPGIVIKINNVNVNSSKYSVTYHNNINAGLANIDISTIDDFDEEICGDVTTLFTINKGSCNISGTLSNSTFSDDYDLYVLTSDCSVNSTVTVPENVTLDLGQYDLNFSSGKLILSNTSKLVVSAGTGTRFNTYKYIADEIILTANINEVLTIDYTNYSNSRYEAHYQKTTVDINGHDVNGFEIKNNSTSRINNVMPTVSITDSSDTKGTIGIATGASGRYGIEVSKNNDFKVNISNTKVLGIKTYGINNYLTLNISNTILLSENLADKYCYYANYNLGNATVNFNGCTFDAYTDMENTTAAIMIKAEDHNMTNCIVKSRSHAIVIDPSSAVKFDISGTSITSSSGSCFSVKQTKTGSITGTIWESGKSINYF